MLIGMKLGVVGSRGFDNPELLVKILDRLRLTRKVETIISGGARGVDLFAQHYAEVNEIPFIVHEAKWGKYGKSAGYIRNKLIWDDSDIILVIWDGVSKGTKHTIEAKENTNKLMLIYNYKLNRWVNKQGEVMDE